MQNVSAMIELKERQLPLGREDEKKNSKGLPEVFDLTFASLKEKGLQDSISVPDGQCVTIEGYITAIKARQLLQQGDSSHTMQLLSLTSNLSPAEGDSVSVVLWDEEEFQAEIGEKIRVIGGILREGKIHVIHSAQLERLEAHEAYNEDVENKGETELAKLIEKELGRILCYYRQKIGPLKATTRQYK